MKFNPNEDHAIVGGRHPLKYLQGGRGYNAKGDYLGLFNDQGEPVAEAVVDPVVEPVVIEPEDSVAEFDREALEQEAKDLGVAFRSTISDEKLAERIAEFKDSQVEAGE